MLCTYAFLFFMPQRNTYPMLHHYYGSFWNYPHDNNILCSKNRLVHNVLCLLN